MKRITSATNTSSFNMRNLKPHVVRDDAQPNLAEQNCFALFAPRSQSCFFTSFASLRNKLVAKKWDASNDGHSDEVPHKLKNVTNRHKHDVEGCMDPRVGVVTIFVSFSLHLPGSLGPQKNVAEFLT